MTCILTQVRGTARFLRFVASRAARAALEPASQGRSPSASWLPMVVCTLPSAPCPHPPLALPPLES